MKDQRGGNNKNGSARDQEYPEVFLEPIEDPGFDQVPADSIRFDFAKKKRRRGLIALLCCALGLIACISVYLFVSAQKRAAEEAAAQLAAEEALRLQIEQERLEFEQLANSTVFLEGIRIDGVAIGGMTLDEARGALASAVSAYQPTGDLQLTYGDKIYSLDLGKLTTSSNLEAVLAEAYRLGKTGDYATMKAESETIKANGRDFTLTASYDFSGITADIALIAAELEVEPADAFVSGVNADTRKIEFSDGVVGVTVEQEALIQTITEAILNGQYAPIAIPVIETQPAVTSEELAAKYTLRAKATTSYSGSNSNRIYNIQKGCALISGTVLKPGDVFSANDTLGTRTTRNGWKMAGAYVGGSVVDEPGGGVCQLSSTLYNAIVKADLEVVYRRNHSMPVNYISEGLDATINSVGNIIDFQFKNNTTSDIVILGYTEDKKLTFEIWGLPFATDEYDEIRLTASLVETLYPSGETVEIQVLEGTEKPDGSLMIAGETYIAVTRRNGSRYQSYKNYYKNDTLVRKEALASSTYKAMAGEIWVCPALEIFDTPIPTLSPGASTDPGTST
ncbi:MAG: VanW family protein, partial [Clostridia bacterium]|nr:VanW family protein [Clostridia bacterium]